jgi:hypothetical protein
MVRVRFNASRQALGSDLVIEGKLAMVLNEGVLVMKVVANLLQGWLEQEEPTFVLNI